MVIITAAFCFLTNVPVIVNTSAPLKQMSGFRFLQHLCFFYQWEEEIISSLRGAAELNWLQNSLTLTLTKLIFVCGMRSRALIRCLCFSLPPTFALPLDVFIM